MNNNQQIVEMESGGYICLYHWPANDPIGLPLIVTHGTISNAKAVRGLARYLLKLGFDCWMLDWGGHGNSKPASRRQNFEYPALHDLPAAVTAVLANTNQSKLCWVSHSGGGHLPLMFYGRFPEKQAQLGGLVTIGAQSTDAALDLRLKIKAAYYWAVTMILNRTPMSILPVGNEEEPTRLLAQWFMWNVRERWHGSDGFNYMGALSKLHIPTLMIAGGNDTIAPASGCHKFFEAIGSEDKTWLLCAKSTGYSIDYTHPRLVIGREARSEIYPKIGDWLLQRYVD